MSATRQRPKLLSYLTAIVIIILPSMRLNVLKWFLPIFRSPDTLYLHTNIAPLSTRTITTVISLDGNEATFIKNARLSRKHSRFDAEIPVIIVCLFS
jgi:hypothetical protein